MNKALIPHTQTIFSRMKKLLRKFFKEKEEIIINEKREKKDFWENIRVNENEEEERLKRLKKLYDNRELKEKNISNEDIDKLIKMYDKEIEELRFDTTRRKI